MHLMTSNEVIQNALIKRQHYLIQYSNGLSKDVRRLLQNTEEDLTKSLLYYATKMDGLAPTSPEYKQLKGKLLVEIDKIRDPAFVAIEKSLGEQYPDFLEQESEYMANLVHAAIPLAVALPIIMPKKTDMKKEFIDTILPKGRTSKEWFSAIATADKSKISQTLMDNVAIPDVDPVVAVRRVTGTKSNKFKDGVMRKAQNGVTALIHTMTSSAQSTAQQNTLKGAGLDNTKVIWRSVLDGRTTPICQTLDGTVYELGKERRPPAHVGCRSLVVPYLDHQNFWNRTFNASVESDFVKDFANQNNLKRITRPDQLPHGFKQAYEKFARTQRRQYVGTIPAKVTYGEFLRNQSVSFQEFVLGKARAKAFRESGLPIDKFINNQGHYLALEELAQKDII